jgi:hypothetical protein
MPHVYLPVEELRALQAVFSWPPPEKVNWAAYDRAKERILQYREDTENDTSAAPRMTLDQSE